MICSKFRIGLVGSVSWIFLSNPVVVLCLDCISDIGRVSIAVFLDISEDQMEVYLICFVSGLD